MLFLNKPVAYLQDKDFDAQGNLVNPQIPKNLPVLIMVQAGFCGHCTHAKPAFQEFANKNVGKVFCATIQGDGKEPGEAELSKRLNDLIPNFVGFPEYVVINNGKLTKKESGGRGVKDLDDFVKSVKS